MFKGHADRAMALYTPPRAGPRHGANKAHMPHPHPNGCERCASLSMCVGNSQRWSARPSLPRHSIVDPKLRGSLHTRARRTSPSSARYDDCAHLQMTCASPRTRTASANNRKRTSSSAFWVAPDATPHTARRTRRVTRMRAQPPLSPGVLGGQQERWPRILACRLECPQPFLCHPTLLCAPSLANAGLASMCELSLSRLRPPPTDLPHARLAAACHSRHPHYGGDGGAPRR